MSKISGISRQTLTKGVKELDNPDTISTSMEQGKNRKPGGGRKSVWEVHPEILDVLSDLVDAHTKGDPMSLLYCKRAEIGLFEKREICYTPFFPIHESPRSKRCYELKFHK
ncbi:MAG: hypothetical protein LBQ50_04810, partial [Planctomycetaceae bacterium]|nr:hypothetical protein [Planctomycetaceae bacterium]